MRINALACQAIVLAFMGLWACGTGQTGMLARPFQAPIPVAEPDVVVSSVIVEPTTIHKTESPHTTTVVVQRFPLGQAPPDPKAVVEVGTYSSDPPENNLKYETPTRTFSLQKGVTVVKFKAESGPQTVRGKLIVTATLSGSTKGINVKDSPLKDSTAELTVLDP
jgi:hypothetical protein